MVYSVIMIQLALLMTVLCTTMLSEVCGENPTNINFPVTRNLEEELAELDPQFTNHWAVSILGGNDVADDIARNLEYINKGQVGCLEGYYSFVKEDHPNRSKRHAQDLTQTLLSDRRVTWVEQQNVKRRIKRESVQEHAHNNIHFDDIYWQQQWYLFDDLENVTDSKTSLNVVQCWKQNVTGRGIVVAVMDDGLEWNHTDIKDNYSPEASYDFIDDDNDPTPPGDAENKHGTQAAGVIAMVANNTACGVGVAFNAKIGGIRMLDSNVTDLVESKALSHALDAIDIYSANWGANDDGKTVEGPGHLASQAIQKGITEGRDGKGVLYVWAAGAGGINDNCNCDGYSGSIHTISISSASETRHSPMYAEKCSSIIATAYSSSNIEQKKIVSTDLHGQCTTDLTGTSASTAIAAGIFALVLESNPALTWRDVQHLIAWTSNYGALKDNLGWRTNGAGFKVNNQFGFGLLDAFAMVTAANPLEFQSVPAKKNCTIDLNLEQSTIFPIQLTTGNPVLINLTTTGCQGQENAINFLEHTQVYLDIEYSRRGDLEILIISPSGTITTLLTSRPRDTSNEGFTNWPFLSLHAWGENPEGLWRIVIADRSNRLNSGQLQAVSLVLHGTTEQPHHVESAGGRRIYEEDWAALKKDYEEVGVDCDCGPDDEEGGEVVAGEEVVEEEKK